MNNFSLPEPTNEALGGRAKIVFQVRFRHYQVSGCIFNAVIDKLIDTK